MSNGKSTIGFIYYFHSFFGFSWVCFHMSLFIYFCFFFISPLFLRQQFGGFMGIKGVFYLFIFSSTWWWKKPPKDLHLLASIHGWQLGDITRGAHNQNIHVRFLQLFRVDFKSYPTSISMITPCMSLCSCRGICLSNTCISFKRTCSPM
jgi:hypothetical protein